MGVHTYVTSGSNNITIQDGSININVLNTAPSTNTTPHTFVRALEDAVITGGGYAHTFQSAVSNATTIYPASARLTAIEKRSGTKSLKLDSGAYLSYALSTVPAFGTSDFTIEMWVRPTTAMNTTK